MSPTICHLSMALEKSHKARIVFSVKNNLFNSFPGANRWDNGVNFRQSNYCLLRIGANVTEEKRRHTSFPEIFDEQISAEKINDHAVSLADQNGKNGILSVALLVPS